MTRPGIEPWSPRPLANTLPMEVKKEIKPNCMKKNRETINPKLDKFIMKVDV